MSVKKPMLVGGWTQPIEKKNSSKNGEFSPTCGEHKKKIELPPPSMVFSHLKIEIKATETG